MKKIIALMLMNLVSIGSESFSMELTGLAYVDPKAWLPEKKASRSNVETKTQEDCLTSCCPLTPFDLIEDKDSEEESSDCVIS